jgi:antitoxin (DNA-binding transcriptional repressor) of toxin-antitoxin stability system
MTTTAEVKAVPGRIAELVDQVKAGNEVVLTEGLKPVTPLIAAAEEKTLPENAGASRWGWSGCWTRATRE